MRNLKEKPKEELETIWEREARIKRTAKTSLPLLHEIEAQRIKNGWRWMSQDGKTMILVAPKNQQLKLENNFKFCKE